MKKALLLLFLALSLPTMAQLQLTADFNFGNPTGLTPSLTPADYNGGKLNIGDKVFTCGNISISFSIGAGSGGGAQLMTTVNPYTGEVGYSLRITQGAVMTISGNNGAKLNSLSFENNSMKGDLALQMGQPGTFSGMTWSSNGADVSSVSFFNTGEAAQLKLIKVNYTDIQDVLVPSTNISDGAQVQSFQSMILTFASTMSQVETSGITMSGTGISGSKALNVSLSGNVVTLTLPGNEQITTDGNFTISVPAGCFRDVQGYQNEALTYSFTVREPRNTLELESITPEPGEVSELPNPISLKFKKPVKLAATSVDLFINDEYEATLENISVSETDHYSVLIPTGTFGKYGIYRITIPEAMVHTTAYGTSSADANDRWNTPITIEYTITEPIDPLKDLKEEAAQLLSLIGSQIGYPASGSNAAQQLTSVTAEGSSPTQEQLEAAIASFYTETNVVMPTEGTWYNILGVNAEDENAYVTYDAGKTGVSGTADDAAAFQFCKNGDDYSFKTADGKYIMILSEQGKTVETISKSSKITVSKLLVAGVDNKLLLGKFKLYGWLGTDDEGTDLGYSMAAIDYSDFSVVATPTANLYFDNSKSSAFIFNETVDPALADMVTPEMSLSPTNVTSNTQTLTLILGNITKASIKDATKPYISTDAAGATPVTTLTAPALLTKATDNTFTVHLNGLAYGTYYLQLPVGTFDYTANDKLVNDIAKSFSFSITEPASEYQTTYDTYTVLQVIERNGAGIDYISDVDLNDLVIIANAESVRVDPNDPSNTEMSVPFYSDLIPDPSVRINVKNYYTGEVVGYGHFEKYPKFKQEHPEFANQGIGYKAIKLVMDSPVTAGSLQYSKDLYCYDIPEAAFGDANFGKYLAGASGIKKENCIVNPKITGPYFQVDNDRATGISDLRVETEDGQKIYDLNGRRVTTPTKGIYIINGKKMVIK